MWQRSGKLRLCPTGNVARTSVLGESSPHICGDAPVLRWEVVARMAEWACPLVRVEVRSHVRVQDGAAVFAGHRRVLHYLQADVSWETGLQCDMGMKVRTARAHTGSHETQKNQSRDTVYTSCEAQRNSARSDGAIINKLPLHAISGTPCSASWTYREALDPLAWRVDGGKGYDAFGRLNSAVWPYIPCKAHAISILQSRKRSHFTSTLAELSSARYISASSFLSCPVLSRRLKTYPMITGAASGAE